MSASFIQDEALFLVPCKELRHIANAITPNLAYL